MATIEILVRKLKPATVKEWGLTIWIIVFTSFTIYLFLAIQQSRESACRQSYQTMRNILTASAQGRTLNAEAVARLNRLKRLADPNLCEERTELRP